MRTIERYSLCDQIASGGMGSVHLGHLHGSGGFGRIVAIKRLHPDLASDPDFVRAFTKEACLAARIRHPNVVPVLDALSDGHELFLVLEYVHGEALHRLLCLDEKRPPAPGIAAAIVRNILEGLHAAHHAVDHLGEPLEIVHRDIAPQNVLVGVDGHARVLDFGISSATGHRESSATKRKGRLAYMAPEQLMSSETSPRSDVYSVSVLFWEALTGRRLFRSTNTLSEIIDTTIPAPSTINKLVPPSLDEVVMRGLERNQMLRYSSARDMALHLERSCILSSDREIGLWVRLRADPLLRERESLISRIEQSSAPPLSLEPEQHPVRSVVVTNAVAGDEEWVLTPLPDLWEETSMWDEASTRVSEDDTLIVPIADVDVDVDESEAATPLPTLAASPTRA